MTSEVPEASNPPWWRYNPQFRVK